MATRDITADTAVMLFTGRVMTVPEMEEPPSPISLTGRLKPNIRPVNRSRMLPVLQNFAGVDFASIQGIL